MVQNKLDQLNLPPGINLLLDRSSGPPITIQYAITWNGDGEIPLIMMSRLADQLKRKLSSIGSSHKTAIFGPADEIRLFDNNIRTLDIFSELSGTLSLPDLKGLEFNQTNDLVRITTDEGFIFDKELKDQIEAFCEASGCSVEFWDTGIILRKEK